MRISLTFVLVLALACPLLAEPIAPRLDGLGEWHFGVTTESEDAQAFFDQGLRLSYGFNHAEAIRAFKEAARLDPGFAMAYWGQAFALGPNINDSMPYERELEALAAIVKAAELASQATEKERDLIEALRTRYTDDENADRGAMNAAYADAMRKLWMKYPNDPEVGTLVTAAIMNTMPWNYMQGQSFVPLLEGEAPSDWRQSFYYQYYEYPGPHDVARHYGVRTERHKLIYFYTLDEWKLYDLEEDPDELISVYEGSGLCERPVRPRDRARAAPRALRRS